MREKPSWDEYFLAIAQVVKTRSSCERDQVGAVIVGSDNRIRATGYNDAPAGDPGCEACPRRLTGVAPGSAYEGRFSCVAHHAEENAILYCDEDDLSFSTLYITREPCYLCQGLIVNKGIRRIVTPVGEFLLNY